MKQSKAGLRAVQKRAAKELIEGDVICYDFNGDGRFDHVALVTAKDKSNMPLVNAQTHDCRMRYWSYEDSPAYTSSIRYAFFIYQMIRQNRNEWYNKQRIRKTEVNTLALHVVLYQPEIPANTGNIARTCAATDTTLHLIRPLGFSTDDKMLKRAGLDYWEFVNVVYHDSLDELFNAHPDGRFSSLQNSVKTAHFI